MMRGLQGFRQVLQVQQTEIERRMRVHVRIELWDGEKFRTYQSGSVVAGRALFDDRYYKKVKQKVEGGTDQEVCVQTLTEKCTLPKLIMVDLLSD